MNKVKISSLNLYKRLDIFARLLFLQNIDRCKDYANSIYKETIRIQTNSSFVDRHNPKINSYDSFIHKFDNLYKSIYTKGIDKNSLIPINTDLTPSNGAHRISICLSLGIEYIYTNTSDTEINVADYKYFTKNNIKEEVIKDMVSSYIDHIDNVYIAFFWPKGNKHKIKDSVKRALGNIAFEFNLKLSFSGGMNLINECYLDSNWIGDHKSNYRGVREKFYKSFTKHEDQDLQVVIFEDKDGIDSVIKKKKIVRDIIGNGYDSIHITDNSSEARRIAPLILSKEALLFMNVSNFQRVRVGEIIDEINAFAELNNIDKKDFVVDGSTILDLTGVRECDDIDVICSSHIRKNIVNTSFVHIRSSNEIKYHGISQNCLVYNSKYYFKFRGIKFISLNQILNVKTVRNEEKDKYDAKIIRNLIQLNKNREFNLVKKYNFYRNNMWILYFRLKKIIRRLI